MGKPRAYAVPEINEEHLALLCADFRLRTGPVLFATDAEARDTYRALRPRLVPWYRLVSGGFDPHAEVVYYGKGKRPTQDDRVGVSRRYTPVSFAQYREFLREVRQTAP